MSTTTKKKSPAEDRAARIEALARTVEQADQSAAADREALAALRAEEAAEQAAAKKAEADRQAERAREWARHYLATAGAEEEQERRAAIRDARRELAEALADEPWVKALTRWQALEDSRGTVAARRNHARSLLGLPEQHGGAGRDLLPRREGDLSGGEFLEALVRVIVTDRGDALAEVRELVATPDGPTDPLTAIRKANADRAEREAADPLARLSRHGAEAVEATRHTTADGAARVMHRNLRSEEWVMTDKDGNVLETSWTKKEEGAPKIDGRQPPEQIIVDNKAQPKKS